MRNKAKQEKLNKKKLSSQERVCNTSDMCEENSQREIKNKYITKGKIRYKL